MPRDKFKLVIVDDSEDERILLRRSLRHCPRCEVIASLPDGQAAIDYLSGANEYADRQRYPLPDVLLLDLKMPRLNGLEVLEWLKQQAFPVQTIVLSNSFGEGDVEKSLRMGARHCLEKHEPSEDAKTIEGFLNSME
jgi:CheY-like chemotaxis protein